MPGAQSPRSSLTDRKQSLVFAKGQNTGQKGNIAISILIASYWKSPNIPFIQEWRQKEAFLIFNG